MSDGRRPLLRVARRHVLEGAEDVSLRRDGAATVALMCPLRETHGGGGGGGPPSCQAEVEELGSTSGQHDFSGLEVAVDDSLCCARIEGSGRLELRFEGLLRW